MNKENQVEDQVEEPQGIDSEKQQYITSEFEKLVSDLKLNQYAAKAIEIYVNVVIQTLASN